MSKIQIPVDQMTHTVSLFKLGHGHMRQILAGLNVQLTPLLSSFEGETAERFAHLYRYAEKNLNTTLELLHTISLRLEQIKVRFVDTDSTMVNISALLDYQANPGTPRNDLVCGPNDPQPKRSVEEHVEAFFNQAGDNVLAVGDSVIQLGKDFIEHPLDTAGNFLYDNTIGTISDIGDGIAFTWNYAWDNGDTRKQAEKHVADEFNKMKQEGGAEYAANITTSMLLGLFGRKVGIKSIDGKQHHSPHTDSGGNSESRKNPNVDSYENETSFHYSHEPTKRGGKSISDQITERGWNDQRLGEAINIPAGTVDWIDQRKGQNNAPVTVFYHQDGGYVVRRNDSGEIIQISQVDDPNWSTYWSDDDINWNK